MLGPKPHGGRLVDRSSDADPAGLSSITVSPDLANDIENIADGIFSPLEGFVTKNDFDAIVSKGRLADDTPWTIPIVLDLDEKTANESKQAGDILIKDPNGSDIAIMHVEEIYRYDKETMCKGVYGTTDPAHPGVAKTLKMQDYLLAGRIDLVGRPADTEIRAHRLKPTETRQAFADAGWKTTVAFQTRNPPHVAHEMLQKTSITTRDGVFVNPLIGKKKSGDFVDELIVKCYEKMIELYYPENRCRLATLHTEMRYAGPKEAIHHAIMRKNYGCTHIIIGRDHAGVGDFYDPFAAQKIFGDYPDLEILPVFFPAFFYCNQCLTFTNTRACPHDSSSHEQVSGTKMRAMIQEGKSPNQYILRPEVSKIILEHPKPFVD